MNIIFIVLGIISIAYDWTLIILNPGTLRDILTCFTHIWSTLGAYLVFLGIYRIKTGHSFWSTWKKWAKLTFVSLFSIGVAIAVINLIFILTPETVSMNESADNVILLGGGIDKDGKLPASVMSRVEKTAEYLNHHPDSICIVTGGTLKWLPYPEAPELKNQLIKKGVSADRILVEDRAKDTIQNFQYSCKMLSDFRGVSIQQILDMPTIVVTSRFHLRRSERLAHRIGFTNIKGIPATCPAIYVPHSYVREICAYVKLNLRILLTGEPSLLTKSN